MKTRWQEIGMKLIEERGQFEDGKGRTQEGLMQLEVRSFNSLQSAFDGSDIIKIKGISKVM